MKQISLLKKIFLAGTVCTILLSFIGCDQALDTAKKVGGITPQKPSQENNGTFKITFNEKELKG